MRKIVIDGSNTGGFQRTVLVATGGYLELNGRQVGVQSICLEEDAAKLISDNGVTREYGLDRLGIPLVEIALEPISGNPRDIMQVALTLGRLLRASKRVARGLGSIRQDVNISVENGSVVEVKGVQQLDQLIKVIEYEAMRQIALNLIAQKIKERNITERQIGDRIQDITDIMSSSSSKVVKKLLQEPDCIFTAIRVKRFSGIIGYEPYEGIRLGKQLGELVRFYGIGGVFHSDELPDYGITSQEVDAVSNRLELEKDDAFVIVGGSKEKVGFAVDAIIKRLQAALSGVPAETRAATIDGRTVFSRPRPGSSRMYPETDIPPIRIDPHHIQELSQKVPRSWDEEVDRISKKYNLNKKIGEQIFDSDYLNIFEKIALSTQIQPVFIASKLTEDVTNLQRQGLDPALLTDEMLVDIFKRLDSEAIAKESVTLIFEKIMRGDAKSTDEAINRLGIKSIDDDELSRAIDKILYENKDIVDKKGMSALGMLMGRAMAVLRGRADGQKINLFMKNKLEHIVRDNRQK